jgi:nitric oxide reductase subunit B
VGRKRYGFSPSPAEYYYCTLCRRRAGLYGLPFAEYLPYIVTRSWHAQLAVFCIATAWLATGLYVAPMMGEHDPKFQRFGVNFLFLILLIIVVGSFVGKWVAVHRFFSDFTMNFCLDIRVMST